MDYEKRYNEIVKAVKELRDVNPHDEGINEWINDKFPELAESEDEKIRKAVVDAVVTLSDSPLKTKMLAWLEKQGEHANFRNKIQIGDKVTRNQDGVLVNLSQLKRVAKPEQKPVVSLDENGEPILTDFESALFTTISYFWQSYNSGEEINIAEFAKEYAPELLEAANKQLKPAWSEEDEERLSDAIFFVREYQIPTRDKRLLNAAKETEDWLRTFKDRVQSKREWSEEDERVLGIIIAELSKLSGKSLSKDEWFRCNDFLNNLRPQNTWKPSDEQIGALIIAQESLSYENDHKSAKIIKDLLEQLKKLMEE